METRQVITNFPRHLKWWIFLVLCTRAFVEGHFKLCLQIKHTHVYLSRQVCKKSSAPDLLYFSLCSFILSILHSFLPFFLPIFFPSSVFPLSPLLSSQHTSLSASLIKKWALHLNTLSFLTCKWNATKGALSLYVYMYVYVHVLTNPNSFSPYSLYHTDQKTQIIVASNNPNMLTFPIHSCQNDVIKSKLHFMVNASG